jgi:plastocyanin
MAGLAEVQEVIMIRARLASAAILAAALLAPAGAQAPAAQVIQVRSFAFAPTPIRLAAGKPVTLTFQNISGSGHDFTAKEFFAYSKITAGSAPEGEIELRGHESKSITLIPRYGTYHAHCSHFMHSLMGMHTEIIVS